MRSMSVLFISILQASRSGKFMDHKLFLGQFVDVGKVFYRNLRKDRGIWAGHGSVRLNSNLGLNDYIWGLEIKDSKAVYIMCPVSHHMIKQWFTTSSVNKNHLCTCQKKVNSGPQSQQFRFMRFSVLCP